MMKVDYFPLDTDIKSDIRVKRMMKALGLEGYGIYISLLQMLCKAKSFRYLISDIDLLADDIGSSIEKIKVVVLSYDLFEIIDEEFFSLYLQEKLTCFIDKKRKDSIRSFKGNSAKYGHYTKDEISAFSEDEILGMCGIEADSPMRSLVGSQVKKSKVKEIKKPTKKDLGSSSFSVNETLPENVLFPSPLPAPPVLMAQFKPLQAKKDQQDHIRAGIGIFRILKETANNPELDYVTTTDWFKATKIFMRKQKLSHDKVGQVLNFAVNHKFWRNNIIDIQSFINSFVKMKNQMETELEEVER